MQFTIDQDLGPVVSGWAVLDDPTAVPRFRVTIGDREIDFDANSERPDLRGLGWHNTGMCGFILTDELVPDLAGARDLQIRELSTGILIYRRFDSASQFEHRLFMFDASVMPQVHLLGIIEGRFGLGYRNIERYAYDTIVNITFNIQAKSIFVHGRPSFSRYSSILRERQYKVVTLLREPIQELAERILFGNMVAKSPKFAPLRRCFTGLDSLLELLAGTAELTPDAFVRRLKAMQPRDRARLGNPMTRMLACDPDETAIRSHVPSALDNLATFDAVSTRSHLDDFKQMLETVLGGEFDVPFECREFDETAHFATELGRHAIIQEMIDLDLLVYNYAKSAVEEVLS